MGRPKGSLNKNKKSPYESLDDGWKDQVSGFSFDKLNLELANIAKAEDENNKAKDDDADLASLKEQVKDASSPYRDASKTHKLKTKYVIEMQEAKGRPAQKGGLVEAVIVTLANDKALDNGEGWDDTDRDDG